MTDKPKTARTTRTFRCDPDVAAELDKYQWGQISDVINKALRKMWKMPAV